MSEPSNLLRFAPPRPEAPPPAVSQSSPAFARPRRSRRVWALVFSAGAVLSLTPSCRKHLTCEDVPACAAAAADAGGMASGGSSGGNSSGDAGLDLGGLGGMPASKPLVPVGTRPLGDSCQEGAECGSAFCANGLCCEAACDDVCMTCSAGGRCVVPKDDPDCGVIPCAPSGTECALVSASAARCGALGVCKTADDCETRAAEPRTACTSPQSDVALCDAEARCNAPTVECDGPCVIGPEICCSGEPGLTCGQDACEGNAGANVTVECDEHTDCALGRRCGYASRINRVYCAPQRTVDYQFSAIYAGGNGYELCESPVASSACSLGTPCSKTFPDLPGWKFCEHPG